MEKFSPGEVIEQAIQTEKLGCSFYASMARKFDRDEQLRNLFETLALHEKKHEKRFSELKGEGRGEEAPENWEEASKYLRAIVESEFFLGKKGPLAPLEGVQTARDAVRFAIAFEKETLLYFHNLRDLVDNKKVVDEIIREEKSHIVWLSEVRDKLRAGKEGSR